MPLYHSFFTEVDVTMPKVTEKRTIVRLQTGENQADVARHMWVSRATVNRLWVRYANTGSTRDRPRSEREREINVLFNDALNTFYLQLYGVRHMVKDHSDSEKGKPMSPTLID